MFDTDIIYDQRHGGPYDRGSCDAYYQRMFNPHYFKGNSYTSEMIGLEDMTTEEIVAYTAGYRDQENSGVFKDWN